MSSEQKVKVPIGTELPDSICYAHSHKHLELGDEVALQVGLGSCRVEGGSSRRLVHEWHHLLHDLQGVHGPGVAARLIVVPMPIFFLDIMSSLPATHRLALAIEHGADAEVAHLHRPARGDEGEKRCGHRWLAGGRADQAQHPVAFHASGAQ